MTLTIMSDLKTIDMLLMIFPDAINNIINKRGRRESAFLVYTASKLEIRDS